MKEVHTSEQARIQMRTNLLNQVKDIKHRKQNQRQNSSEVVKKVKEHLSKIPGGQNLAEKMEVLKQKLQKGDCDSEKDRQTVMISNAEKVSKKVEERLARMEARLEVEKLLTRQQAKDLALLLQQEKEGSKEVHGKVGGSVGSQRGDSGRAGNKGGGDGLQ